MGLRISQHNWKSAFVFTFFFLRISFFHIVKLQFDTQKGKRRLKSSLREQKYYTEMGNMYLQKHNKSKPNPRSNQI